MKTEATRPLAALWVALSEVPGWPDAPLRVRLRRLWPLALPLVGCLVLLVWTGLVREPLRRDVRAAHAGVLALEEETEQLRQSLSEQTAADLTTAAASARAQLLESPAVLQDRLQAFVTAARAAGWEATFQTYGLADDGTAAADGSLLVFAPARVRLVPLAGNSDCFTSLVATLARLAATPGRVEITRASVRSEAPGVPVVEVNLRAACRPPSDEKAAE